MTSVLRSRHLHLALGTLLALAVGCTRGEHRAPLTQHVPAPEQPAATLPAPDATTIPTTLPATTQAAVETPLTTTPAEVVPATIQPIPATTPEPATAPQTRPSTQPTPASMPSQPRPADSLRIPAVALCTRVDGFGIHDTIGPQKLSAFRESGVVLYCELQGQTSRRQELNWETRLLQQLSLIDAQGQTIWQDRPNTIVDLHNSIRRDFFIARVIHLPGSLPEGKYTLRVTIEDQLSGRKAQADLAVQMAAR